MLLRWNTLTVLLFKGVLWHFGGHLGFQEIVKGESFTHPWILSVMAFLRLCESYTFYFLSGRTSFILSLLLCVRLDAQVFPHWVKLCKILTIFRLCCNKASIKHIPIKHCNIPIARRKCMEVVKEASSLILSKEHFNKKQKQKQKLKIIIYYDNLIILILESDHDQNCIFTP